MTMNIKNNTNKAVVKSMTDEELETLGQMIATEMELRMQEAE